MRRTCISPVLSLLVLVVALVLFFVSMMADLLVDRLADAIAILRSRGTSRSQVFGAFVTQSVGLGLVALLTGSLLAVVLVFVVAQRVLPPAAQSALHLVEGNPVPVTLGVGWLALATAAALVVPVLVFTGIPASGGSDTSNGAFYVSQSVPPVQVIASPWLALALAALVMICVSALALMVRVVLRPSIGQALRLNED